MEHDRQARPLPVLQPYQRHVLFCVGKHCDPQKTRGLIRYMKAVLEAVGVGSDRVRVNRAGCLGVCDQGAIVCIYPEAVWYCRVDEAAVDRIVQQHLLGDQVVEDLLFHHNRFDKPKGVL